MKRAFFILTMFLGCASSANCVEQTAVIAAKMRYPETIVKLRNRTDNWLRDYRIEMRENIQKLRSKDLELRAEEFAVLSKDAYFMLEKKIDQAFEELNKEFIRVAKRLDSEDAPLKTKQAFVTKMSAKAEQKIDEFQKKERSFFAK